MVFWALKTLCPYLIYYNLTVYTYHASFHWLLTVNNTSGRLIRWRLRLAEFDFDIKHKKGKSNTQADSLSRLKVKIKTIPHDDSDEIPLFLFGETKLKLELNKSADEFYFIDVGFNSIDSFYETMDKPQVPSINFEPIGLDKVLQAQLHN